MSSSEPEPEPIDTLEEDLGNLSLLTILLIVTVLIFTIPIGLVIESFKQLYRYLRNFLNFSNNYFKNKLCK